jgi:hypothetical protein
MSSIGFRLADKAWDAGNVIASLYPASDRLVGWYALGGSSAASIANKFNPAAPATQIGSPTFNALSAVCSQTACFDSGIVLPGDRTFIVVAKIPTNRAMMMGDYLAAGTPTGDALGYAPSTSALRAILSGGGSADAAFQKLNSAVPVAPGTGYTVGDTISLSGGAWTTRAVVTVSSVGTGGAVTGLTVSNPGVYSTGPGNPVAQFMSGGAGTGCTMTCTFGFLLDVTKFRVMAGTYSATAAKMYVWDSGSLTQVNFVATAHPVSPRTVRIGSSQDGTATFNGGTELAHASLWNGVLTTAEIAAVRDQLIAQYGTSLGNAL